MKPLSKEEAIRLHKEMWNYVKDNFRPHEKEKSRSLLKSDFIFNKLGYNEPVKNECFLCEYAMQQFRKFNKDTELEYRGLYCKYCPAIWGTENITNKFFCERGYDNTIDWRFSNIDDIIDIKIKED